MSPLLRLSTEQLWAVIDHIEDPYDILSLSATCRWCLEVVRDPLPWTRHLVRDGWGIEAILRQGLERPKWLILAQAAVARWVVEWTLEWVPGKPDDEVMPRNVFWEKLYEVTSQIDSDHPYFARLAEATSQYMSRDDVHASIRTKYYAMIALTRFVYHEISTANPDLILTEKRWHNMQIVMDDVLNDTPFSPNDRWASTPWHLPQHASGEAQFQFIGLAALLFTQFMVAIAGNVDAFEVQYPTKQIPSTAYGSDIMNPVSWVTDTGNAWLSQSSLKLTGYFTESDEGQVEDINPDMINQTAMTMTLKPNSSKPGHFEGTGIDGVGGFAISGFQSGCRFIMEKRYSTHAWSYRGVTLPWGLVGYWYWASEPGEDDDGDEGPQGGFCLWPTE